MSSQRGHLTVIANSTAVASCCSSQIPCLSERRFGLFQKWREEILLKEAPPAVFAQLGYGMLHSAMVEVAAYCLEKGREVAA